MFGSRPQTSNEIILQSPATQEMKQFFLSRLSATHTENDVPRFLQPYGFVGLVQMMYRIYILYILYIYTYVCIDANIMSTYASAEVNFLYIQE